MLDLIFWQQAFVFMFVLLYSICRHVRLGTLETSLCVYVCVGCISCVVFVFLFCVIFFCVVFYLLFVSFYIVLCCIKRNSPSETASSDTYLVAFWSDLK